MAEDINPSLDERELEDLYLKNKFAGISQKFLEILSYFEEHTFLLIGIQEQYFINIFVKNFLHFFAKEDFIIPVEHQELYITMHQIISNIVAMSDFKTTDPYIKILLNQKNNLIKILILYSNRNELEIDYKLLFETNPYFCSLWYCMYFIGSKVSRHCYEGFSRHIEYFDKIIDNFTATHHIRLVEPYFGINYLETNGKDRLIKSKINELIKANFNLSNIKIKNTSQHLNGKKKIAIISARWNPKTSVYRVYSNHIKTLAEDYDLTLIQLSVEHPDVDKSLFSDIKTIKIEGRAIDISSIIENDFAVAIFTDIGMDPETVYLSNLKIAPIQIMLGGHPISTFKSEIDYYIEAENLGYSQGDFSERLVLIKGSMVKPTYPDYEIKGLKKQTDVFVVSCGFSFVKMNYPLFSDIKEILSKVNKKVVFRFYLSGGDRWNFYIPTVKEIVEILGAQNVQCFPTRQYNEYMESVEECDIALDSHPFTGFDSVIDALYLAKPIVVFEGKRSYNKSAALVLKLLHLKELIAKNRKEYISKTVKLINDDKYREMIIDNLSKVDLEGKIFKNDSAKYFKQAINYLIENHHSLKNDTLKEPVLIK